jgi:teichuronic acid biosynthesis glycosyltransferase TuaC
MTRIAVVSPEFPVPDEPHRGQPIYMTILGLTSCPGIELEVFCPTATYPALLNHRFNRAWIQALKDHSPPGVRAHYFGYPALPAISRPTNGYMSAYTLLPRLRAFRPDLILAYWLYPEGFGAVTAGKYLGVPVVVGARGTDLRWIQDRVSRYFVRKTLRQADAVLTVSEELRRCAIELGAEPSHAHSILNGCDSSVFHYRDRDEARARMGLDKASKLILYVGRLVAAKGLLELILAMGDLVRQDPAFHLYCIGDGEFSAPMTAKANELQVMEHIHFLGNQLPRDVAAWMCSADVFCLPSHTEGCPNVIIESMSCGTPVVATHVGGIPELVDRESGITVPPYQSEPLASALRLACSQDWNRVQISQRLQRGWGKVAQETLAVCQAVLSADPRRS